MQVNEVVIRNVVEEVLSRLGNGAAGAPVGGGYAGRFGLFTCVNEAVAASRDAFEQLSRRTIEDRKRIIDHIRRIAIDRIKLFRGRIGCGELEYRNNRGRSVCPRDDQRRVFNIRDQVPRSVVHERRPALCDLGKSIALAQGVAEHRAIDIERPDLPRFRCADRGLPRSRPS